MAGPAEGPNCGFCSPPGTVHGDCGYNLTPGTVTPVGRPADLGLGPFRFLPLIVWGTISLVPPLLTVLVWFLWTSFGISIGYKVEKWRGFLDCLGISPLIALANWPFPILYIVSRAYAKKRWPRVGPIRAGMWGSVIAMSIPNVVVLLETPDELLSAAHDAGQGLGMWMGLELIFLPVLGVIGWALGSLPALVWESWRQVKEWKPWKSWLKAEEWRPWKDGNQHQ